MLWNCLERSSERSLGWFIIYISLLNGSQTTYAFRLDLNVHGAIQYLVFYEPLAETVCDRVNPRVNAR